VGKFDWPVIVVFVVALTPKIARFIKSISVSKEGLEASFQEGPDTVPSAPELPAALNVDAQRGAAAPPVSAFGSLYQPEKRFLKTLWVNQKVFQGPPDKRWGFTIARPNPEAVDFVISRARLINKGWVALGAKRSLSFLTDAGIRFCRENDAEIMAYPDSYQNFAPLD
jgi:hypothetical protein